MRCSKMGHLVGVIFHSHFHSHHALGPVGPVAPRDCHVKFEKANACLMVSGSLEAIEMVRFRVECMTGQHRDQRLD